MHILVRITPSSQSWICHRVWYIAVQMLKGPCENHMSQWREYGLCLSLRSRQSGSWKIDRGIWSLAERVCCCLRHHRRGGHEQQSFPPSNTTMVLYTSVVSPYTRGWLTHWVGFWESSSRLCIATRSFSTDCLGRGFYYSSTEVGGAALVRWRLWWNRAQCGHRLMQCSYTLDEIADAHKHIQANRNNVVLWMSYRPFPRPARLTFNEMQNKVTWPRPLGMAKSPMNLICILFASSLLDSVQWETGKGWNEKLKMKRLKKLKIDEKGWNCVRGSL